MAMDRISHVSYTDSGNTSRAASPYSITSSNPSSYAIYDETKPLLQPAVPLPQHDDTCTDTPTNIATASPLSSVINLSNTILGTGMLAMVCNIEICSFIPI
jgi:hypothetical protein